MSPEDAARFRRFLEEGSTAGLTPEELAGIRKVDDYLALDRVDYDDVLALRRGAAEERISTIELLTSQNVKNAIENNGLSVDDFSKLLNPNRELSFEELQIVNKGRSDIGLPQEGTIMNKIIPQYDLYKYLNGDYGSVRGFVSVDEHSSSLVGLKAVYEGNRLDYNNTAFKTSYGVDGVSASVGAPDTVYGKITYILDEADSVRIPTDVPTIDNAPYTGRGVTGSRNIILPELVQEARNFMDGDILGIYDSTTGKLIYHFVYDSELGWISK